MPDQFFFLKHLWLVTNRLRDTVIVYPNSEAPKCLNSEGPPKDVIIYKKKLFFFVLKNKLLQKKNFRWEYPLCASFNSGAYSIL
jgi:hypothetical protein